jgi:hypothetical protein
LTPSSRNMLDASSGELCFQSHILKDSTL